MTQITKGKVQGKVVTNALNDNKVPIHMESI